MNVKYANYLLDKVQWVFIRQEEIGESELKVVTMGMLATLHMMWSQDKELWRCGGRRACGWQAYSTCTCWSRVRSWTEICEVTALLRSIMHRFEEVQEIVILSGHLVPVWQEVVQDDNMAVIFPVA